VSRSKFLYVAIVAGLCAIVVRLASAPAQAALECQSRLDKIEDRLGIDEKLLLMAVESSP
jgi:hypothetical protein